MLPSVVPSRLRATLCLERVRIAATAAAARLPTVYGFRDHVEASGFISYGVDLHACLHRAATYVFKILKGARAKRIRKYAAELVALTPDVILAAGGTVMAPLQQATRAVPIVFTQTTDPVGAGFVATLARPGGNATGFILFEFGISVKWLELIRDIASRVTRAAVLRDPTVPSALGQLGAVQGVAPSFGVELILVDVRDAPEIERAVTAFAREVNGSLIVLPSASAIVHRDLIITLAARYKLPAVYPARYFVTGGGLISYGPDTIDPHRRAAGYVDRILRGEKAADLPVQAPTKYELVINLKTAKALGLDIPATVLARADEVIE
jgi:putative ABC transport system substrate-binding protein